MFKWLIVSLMISMSNFLFANVNVVVSILPQQTFVEKVGGDKVNVTTMVQAGSSPHSYEPKPSQMKALSYADVYFLIKVEFEKAWLEKFTQQNQKMLLSDMTQGIEFLEMSAHSHEEHEELHHNHEKLDPHTWTSPKNVKIMALNIYNTLVKLDSKNSAYYKKNYENFLQEIEETDKKIRKSLSSLPKNSKIMVFHPSWGYFARDYGLIQIAIEVEGKEPKFKMLTRIIKEARKENVKVIFAQKELSDSSAQAIANELNLKVLKETPLAKEWSKNLIGIGQKIANNN